MLLLEIKQQAENKWGFDVFPGFCLHLSCIVSCMILIHRDYAKDFQTVHKINLTVTITLASPIQPGFY